jgi:hypothetical protein
MHYIAWLKYNLIGYWMQPYDWLSYAKSPLAKLLTTFNKLINFAKPSYWLHMV